MSGVILVFEHHVNGVHHVSGYLYRVSVGIHKAYVDQIFFVNGNKAVDILLVFALHKLVEHPFPLDKD